MPELPEVETCRRSLSRWTAGRRVVSVDLLDPRSVRQGRSDRPTAGHPEGKAALQAVVLAAAPGDIERHGKRLLWHFGARALLLHLGMTGRWSRAAPAYAKVRLRLDDGEALVFADPRLLGGIVPTEVESGRILLRQGLGPDALDAPLPALMGRRPIKVALMDQTVVAGLGNLHAAEALWRAGIDPRVPAGDVIGERHTALQKAVRDQLEGTLTMLSKDEEIEYVEDAGADNPFPLYQRAGSPCPRCGAAIAKLTQAGRSTWWCPGCQR